MQPPDTDPVFGLDLKKVVAAERFAQHIRISGHLDAKLDPLGMREKDKTPHLDLAEFGLTEEDLR